MLCKRILAKEGKTKLTTVKKKSTKTYLIRLKATLMVGTMIAGLITVPGASQKAYAANGTAEELVALAASQVGYHEKASNANLDDFYANSGSGNYNKYARDIGVANGQAWCATFVWWLMRNAGVPDSAYPSRTTVTRDWFNQRGLYRPRGTYVPKPGDYVIFGNVAHCGIVESVSGSNITTIEGNSSDQVKRNPYTLSSACILGYGIINYNGAPAGGNVAPANTQSDNPGSPYPIPSGNLRMGARGENVKWIQKFANDVMGAGIDVDGIYGNQTVNAVRVFQKNNGLTVDGICGTQTTGKMLNAWKNKIEEQRKAAEAAKAAEPKLLDLGSTFTGLIIRKDIWKTIRNNGSNVELFKEEENGMFYWVFTRQSDGTYKIKSEYDGKYLDAAMAGKENGTNVLTWEWYNGDNQKWYIYSNGDGYRLVPKHATDKCLDIAGAGTDDRVNAMLCSWNDTVAQRFAIYKDSFGVISDLKILYEGKVVDNINSSPNENICFKTSLTPSNTMCKAIDWSTSDNNIATVDKSGNVTLLNEGTVTITATSHYDNRISSSVTVTIKNPEIEDAVTEDVSEETSEETPDDSSTDSTEETPIEEPKEQLTSEEISVEEPKEQSTSEEISVEEPKEQSTSEEIPVEEPKEQPTSDETAVKEPKEQPTLEETMVEGPKEQPTVENTSEEKSDGQVPTMEADTEEAYYYIDNPTIKKAVNSKRRSMKIRISSVQDADGYEYTVAKVTGKTLKKFKKAVYRADEDCISFKGSKTFISKSTAVKLTGLKKNKRYAVAVRTYKIVNGNKYYSTYSTVKCVKIKK